MGPREPEAVVLLVRSNSIARKKEKEPKLCYILMYISVWLTLQGTVVFAFGGQRNKTKNIYLGKNGALTYLACSSPAWCNGVEDAE